LLKTSLEKVKVEILDYTMKSGKVQIWDYTMKSGMVQMQVQKLVKYKYNMTHHQVIQKKSTKMPQHLVKTRGMVPLV
jgi:hypothetical protein